MTSTDQTSNSLLSAARRGVADAFGAFFGVVAGIDRWKGNGLSASAPAVANFAGFGAATFDTAVNVAKIWGGHSEHNREATGEGFAGILGEAGGGTLGLISALVLHQSRAAIGISGAMACVGSMTATYAHQNLSGFRQMTDRAIGI